MATLVLHNYELDENAYKLRLLIGFLGLDVTLRGLDMYPGAAHLAPAFRAKSPQGALPVLEDGDITLAGAETCLAYLANTYHPGRDWLPLDPQPFADIQHWLIFAARRLDAAVTARHAALFAAPDRNACSGAAARAFTEMEDHMVRRGFDGLDWFAATTPTIADIALFPSFALSRDFGIDHDEYPALRAWSRRFRALPAFRTMPGIPDYH